MKERIVKRSASATPEKLTEEVMKEMNELLEIEFKDEQRHSLRFWMRETAKLAIKKATEKAEKEKVINLFTESVTIGKIGNLKDILNQARHEEREKTIKEVEEKSNIDWLIGASVGDIIIPKKDWQALKRRKG